LRKILSRILFAGLDLTGVASFDNTCSWSDSMIHSRIDWNSTGVFTLSARPEDAAIDVDGMGASVDGISAAVDNVGIVVIVDDAGGAGGTDVDAGSGGAFSMALGSCAAAFCDLVACAAGGAGGAGGTGGSEDETGGGRELSIASRSVVGLPTGGTAETLSVG
jgi:hypothetical protein